MRLGVGSFTLAWAVGVPGHLPARPLDAFGLLDAAARLGARVVQYGDNLPLTGLSGSELDRLAGTARERGIDVEVGTRGLDHAGLRATLAVAEVVASPFVRVVIDRGADEPTPDEVVARLAPLRPEFERAGVRLGLENHDRFPARTLAGIVESLGTRWVGVVLDTVNSLGAGEGLAEVTRALAPHTLNLHVKDFRVRRVEHQMGFVVEGRPAGEGMLDVPGLLGTLRGAGRDVNAVLELWTPPQATLEETVELERRWAESSVAFLRDALAGVGA